MEWSAHVLPADKSVSLGEAYTAKGRPIQDESCTCRHMHHKHRERIIGSIWTCGNNGLSEITSRMWYYWSEMYVVVLYLAFHLSTEGPHANHQKIPLSLEFWRAPGPHISRDMELGGPIPRGQRYSNSQVFGSGPRSSVCSLPLVTYHLNVYNEFGGAWNSYLLGWQFDTFCMQCNIHSAYVAHFYVLS